MGATAVDEYWGAICQALEGSEWEALYHNCKELHEASKVGISGNPREEPDRCFARRAGTYRAKMRGGILSNERIVKPEAFGSFCFWHDGRNGMSSDEENSVFSSGVRLRVVLVSAPAIFFCAEELCLVALTCHFPLDWIFLCQG